VAAHKASPHLRQIVRLVERQCDRPLSVNVIARTLGLRATYVSRLFREQRGWGIRAYIVRVRMQRAAKLIREGVKVEAVALLVGYRSRPNFYRQFKRHFGVTPAQLRGRMPTRQR
jgi:AraC-like DNA-binding protein